MTDRRRWAWLWILVLTGCTEKAATQKDVPIARPRPAVATETPAAAGKQAATNDPATSTPAEGTVAAVAEPGFDWPHWRGPHDDGISRETLWQAEHWPSGGLPKLWSKSIGIGFSSISVAGGRALTMGHAGGLDTVWCFDAATGAELWKYSYPAKLVDNLHEGGPATTPTVDGDRVYTISKEGLMLCLDARGGEVVWSREFQRQFGVKMPDWGFSCSPLIAGELVIVDAGCAAAFDKRTGDLRWHTAIFRPGYGSPVAFQHGGERCVAILNNDFLLVLRAADGAEIDRFPWTTDYATSSTTPIVDGDTLFISTGYNKGCALLKLVGGGLDLVYQNKKMRNHMNNCVLFEGSLYGFDGNSHNARLVNLACMDYATGAVKWTHNGLGCGSLMLAGDKLLVLSDEGELLTALASPEGFRPLARAQVLEGKCWTVPVLSHGRIYCRDAAGDLECLDVRASGI
jgi:outer membrane protein assembly factor BamB